MDDARTHLLHEHYRDTCAIAQGMRSARDRYFYLILIVLALVLFDVYSPATASTLLSEWIAKRLGIGRAPELAFVLSLLRFLLLGLTIRYCQVVLLLERQYGYLHDLEKEIAAAVGPAFGREGRAYLSGYSAFMTCAHYLYTFAFPLLLLIVVSVWVIREVPGWPPWGGVVYVDVLTAIGMWLFVVLYLHAFHRKRNMRPPKTD